MSKPPIGIDFNSSLQARFYGIEKYGVFEKKESGAWAVTPNLAKRIKEFVANCKKAGVIELSEGGLSPDAYQAEWDAILAAGVTPTIATGATVTLQYPFAPEYPAKGNRTLVDGTPGYSDFSYNWLCFYGNDMIATIDLGASKNISSIRVDFLDDPRHWIFLPAKVIIGVSEDGVTYKPYKTFINDPEAEHYEVKVARYQAEVLLKARYIKVTAGNLPTLPEWRYRENKKPMIACSEVYVQ